MRALGVRHSSRLHTILHLPLGGGNSSLFHIEMRTLDSANFFLL